MEIEYRLLAEDYQALRRYDVRSRKGIYRPRRPGEQDAPKPMSGWLFYPLATFGATLGGLGAGALISPLVLWVLFTAFFVIYGYGPAPPAPWTVFVPGILLGIGVALLVQYWYRRWLISRWPRLYEQGARRLGPGIWRLTISPEGVAVKTDVTLDFRHWALFDRVVERKRYIFLFLDLRNALIVPLRAFRDAVHFQEFLHLAVRYHEAAFWPANEVSALPENVPTKTPTAITVKPQITENP
jgi:hypothetical protein